MVDGGNVPLPVNDREDQGARLIDQISGQERGVDLAAALEQQASELERFGDTRDGVREPVAIGSRKGDGNATGGKVFHPAITDPVRDHKDQVITLDVSCLGLQAPAAIKADDDPLSKPPQNRSGRDDGAEANAGGPTGMSSSMVRRPTIQPSASRRSAVVSYNAVNASSLIGHRRVSRRPSREEAMWQMIFGRDMKRTMTDEGGSGGGSARRNTRLPSILGVADRPQPGDGRSVQAFLNGDVRHRNVGCGACQCFTSAGIQTTSPGRISWMGAPAR